ncbi:MAG: hypothetical protein KIT31_14530 [Deltaproteobacteria bacterium]|nr:hypothetical protein [Deltaproteobacteria bacterium]
MRCAWLLVVAACGGGADKNGGDDKRPGSGSPGSASGSGSADAPKKTLSVKLDGAPLSLERAYIKRVSPDHWRILVGDKEGSCGELLAGVTNRQQGATSFVATIRRRLGADGKFTTSVTDFWSAGHPTEARFAGASVTGDTARGKKVDVELAPIVDVDGKKKLEIAGAFVAEGCGDHPDSGFGVPKAKHPSTAKLAIAGHELALRGAILNGSDVVLSTGPKDCSRATAFAQVVLSHAYGRWELSGTWIAEPVQVADRSDKNTMKELTLKAGAAGTSADGPTAKLALGGRGTIGGYAIELSGEIEAIDCPKPK